MIKKISNLLSKALSVVAVHHCFVLFSFVTIAGHAQSTEISSQIIDPQVADLIQQRKNILLNSSSDKQQQHSNNSVALPSHSSHIPSLSQTKETESPLQKEPKRILRPRGQTTGIRGGEMPSSVPTVPSTKPQTTPLPATITYRSLRDLAYSGHAKEAIGLAQEYLKSHDNVDVRVLLARMLNWQHQYPEAILQLKRVLSQYHGYYDAIDALTDIYMAQGNYTAAIATLNQGLEENPDDAHFLKKQLKAKENLNPKISKPTKALTPISSLIPGFPTPTTSYQQIRTLAYAGHTDKAIELAQGYLKIEDNLDIRVLLGHLYTWKKQFVPAREQFTIVLTKSANYYDAIDGLADLDISEGKYKEAVAVLDKGLKIKPDDKNFLNKRTRALQRSSGATVENAKPEIKPSALKKREALPRGISYQKIKNIYLSGNHQQAIELAQHTLSEHDDIDVRLILGEMLAWQKEYPAAEIQFRQILSKKPDYVDASLGLANAQSWSGNQAAALATLDMGLALHPNNKALLIKRRQILQAPAIIPESGIQVTPVNSDFNHVISIDGYSNAGFPSATVVSTSGVVNPIKKNAFTLQNEYSHVTDLDQNWYLNSVEYQRYTSYGPIIGRINHAYRYRQYGNQYELDAYPKLGHYGYLYLNYSTSDVGYFPQNRYSGEAYFNLPQQYEFSIGERYLEYAAQPPEISQTIIHVYTGSFGKYIGKYWFSFRPYIATGGGKSYFFSARKYFTDLEFISASIGGGSQTGNPDDPENLPVKKSIIGTLKAQYPLNDSFFLIGVLQYTDETFTNNVVRCEIDADLGITWRF